MWFNFWTGGFLTGLLLAQFFQLQPLPWPLLVLALVLLTQRACRHPILWATCGFLYGSFHNAPFPERELTYAQSVQHNPLQFFFGNAIATASPHNRWLVRGYPYSRGRVPSNYGVQRHFIFAQPPRIDAPPTNTAPTLVREPRFYLLRQADQLSDPLRSWISSITLGKRKQMPSTLRDSFRLLGLFHILVISGLHITIIAVGSKKIVDFALRSLYVVRLLTPHVWFFLHKAVSLLSCLLILIYGCIVGFSPPAQRAVLLFIVHQGHALCDSDTPITHKLAKVLFLQMLLFPIGFLSDSLLLSWGAYLIVLHCFREVQHARTPAHKIVALLRGQLIITILILCFFKELSLLSIPLNIILLPLIPYILISGFLLLLLPQDMLLAHWIQQSHLAFLQQIANLAEIASNYRWLTVDIGNSTPLQLGLFVILLVMMSSRAAFMTKSEVKIDQGGEIEPRKTLGRQEGARRR